MLKTMGGISLGSVLRPIAGGLAGAAFAGCCSDRITLNVVLHGLFVVDFLDDHLQLLAPDVPEHIYRAGNFDAPHVGELCRDVVYTLKLGSGSRRVPPNHQVQGLSRISKPDAKQRHHDFRIHPECSRITVELPFPAEIRPLRRLTGSDLYAGEDLDLVQGSALCLCLVLIYHDVSSCVRLENLPKWKPEIREPPINSKTKTANLHFWAEPSGHVDYGHGVDAYQRVKYVVPLDFTLIADEVPPLDGETDVPGVAPFEEQGWAEWASGGEGTRPENCGVVITHQQPGNKPIGASAPPRKDA